MPKQTNFAKQEGTAVATLSQDKTTMSTGNVLVPGIYAIVDRTPATTTPSGGTAVKTTASIMMMNGTAVNGISQLRTASGTTLTLGQVIYKVSSVETPDKKVNVGSTWKDSASEAIGKNLTYRVTQKIPNWTGYDHYLSCVERHARHRPRLWFAHLNHRRRQSISKHVLQGKRQRQNHQLAVRHQRRHPRLGRIKGSPTGRRDDHRHLHGPTQRQRGHRQPLQRRLQIEPGILRHRPATHGRTHNNQPGNEVKVCTGEIALRKVDTKNQKLTGAKFTIAQGTSDKTPLKLVSLGNGNYRLATSGDTTTTTTFEAGETKIQGLKGEYTITETQAPQDYSSLMLPSAVVTVNIDDATMTWSIDVKSDPNNLIKKDDSHTVVVTNIRTITEIPLTGAAGLTMLFSIAALLFIGGIVMLRMCKSADDC